MYCNLILHLPQLGESTAETIYTRNKLMQHGQEQTTAVKTKGATTISQELF
jgi:hypothetical protein